MIFLTAVLVFILNIPFGYWRVNVNKFSLQWFLAIHIPVPFIIFLRFITDIGFAWYTYVFLVLAFFIGQRAGAWFNSWFLTHNFQTSSCMINDLRRAFWSR